METPLHIAARLKDREKCSELLLKSGADPDMPRDDGQTPLHLAAHYGNIRSMNLFLDNGAQPVFHAEVAINPIWQCYQI